MLLGFSGSHDASLFTLRARDLIKMVKMEYSHIKKGAIVLWGAFENERSVFRQESSFYYLTGIKEPGVVAVFSLEGRLTLYVPEHGGDRSAWVYAAVPLTPENAKKVGFDDIIPLGEKVSGYQFHVWGDQKQYKNLTQFLNQLVQEHGTIFTLAPENAYEYTEQRYLISRFDSFIPGLAASCINIADIVAYMRRKKDMREIEHIYKVVEITILAQGAAAQAIDDGIIECEVQASIEYMFTGSGARPAFPSIIAGGKNGTILHYNANKDVLKNGQLAVVDIGAELDYYCADLTRTYPVSGTFTKRQKELYNLVLETQEYIANLAKPGMWLSNKDKPEQSLNHLAKKFLQERGYGNYFIHGIGHFLGIDVHDVGNLQDPLQDGDVFTIEPGIYIPQENIGIRIEDNYWMAKDNVICLSESLAKRPEDIEALMKAVELDHHDDETVEELLDEEDTELDLAHG